MIKFIDTIDAFAMNERLQEDFEFFVSWDLISVAGAYVVNGQLVCNLHEPLRCYMTGSHITSVNVVKMPIFVERRLQYYIGYFYKTEFGFTPIFSSIHAIADYLLAMLSTHRNVVLREGGNAAHEIRFSNNERTGVFAIIRESDLERFNAGDLLDMPVHLQSVCTEDDYHATLDKANAMNSNLIGEKYIVVKSAVNFWRLS